MHPLFVNGLVLLGLYMASIPDSVLISGTLVMDQEVPTKRCRYSRAYSMAQASCSGMNLREIPKNLQSDIKVLDFSTNRLRELKNDSLSPYTSLTYLYLGDNFIQEFEENAFSPVSYLEVLDLTQNSLHELPSSIFSMPYLRKLYLSDNLLENKAFPKDISSPLEHLQLSNNKLIKVPEIGNHTKLVYLNVSNNEITKITPEDIAPFCSLKTLDLTINRIRFNHSGCDCHIFNFWIETVGVSVRPTFDCNKDVNEVCMKKKFTNRTMSLHENCLEIIKVEAASVKARTTWIIVASCISAFIVCLFIVMCCIHRRNKKRRRRRLKDEQRLAANNANTELLNSNLQEQT